MASEYWKHQEERICEICGEVFTCYKGNKSTTCSFACRGKKCSKSAKHIPRMIAGYRYIYCPEHPHAFRNCTVEGYVPEHVLVWTGYHKRQRPEGHIIHHIDGDELNNDIKNLELLTRIEHLRVHQPWTYKR